MSDLNKSFTVQQLIEVLGGNTLNTVLSSPDCALHDEGENIDGIRSVKQLTFRPHFESNQVELVFSEKVYQKDSKTPIRNKGIFRTSYSMAIGILKAISYIDSINNIASGEEVVFHHHQKYRAGVLLDLPEVDRVSVRSMQIPNWPGRGTVISFNGYSEFSEDHITIHMYVLPFSLKSNRITVMPNSPLKASLIGEWVDVVRNALLHVQATHYNPSSKLDDGR